MTDLPTQLDIQQHHARSVLAQDLEVFGKRASAAWASGQCKTLGEAVIETIKSAALSPEQVRRVVEFANTDAYLEAFHKTGEAHKYVDFGAGVLADPREVLRDLNDGGSPVPFDRGTADYDQPPLEFSKAASSREEDAFAQAFVSDSPQEQIPMANPMGWVWDYREKLSSVHSHLSSELGGLEVAHLDVSGRLIDLVKQAALNGVELGQMVRAWHAVTEEPVFIKAAFALFTPRLLEDQVFPSLDAVGASIEKTGSASVVNPAHPLVGAFSDYCEIITKLAEVRQDRDRIATKYAQLNHAIKTFGGNSEKIAKWVEHLHNLSEAAKRVAGGPGTLAGEAAGLGVKAAPVVIGLGGAKALSDMAATSGPGMAFNTYLNPFSQTHKQQIMYRQQMNQPQ